MIIYIIQLQRERGMKMDIAKEIRKRCIDNDITIGELCEMTHQTRQNLANKMKRNNFTIRQLEEIFGILGYDIDILITKRTPPKDDNEI